MALQHDPWPCDMIYQVKDGIMLLNVNRNHLRFIRDSFPAGWTFGQAVAPFGQNTTALRNISQENKSLKPQMISQLGGPLVTLFYLSDKTPLF